MNIAKLNTVSLDDKTFIIKRGTSGGATINNQNKVVDIAENGTVEVVPDAGYTGLAKVTANVNVASNGGELEEKIDIIYVKKDALFAAFEATASPDMTQEELLNVIFIIMPTFNICGFKKTNGYYFPSSIILEEIEENRFTISNWDSVAIDFNTMTLEVNTPRPIPLWSKFGSENVAEAKEFINMLFPAQMTEQEFFNK